MIDLKLLNETETLSLKVKEASGDGGKEEIYIGSGEMPQGYKLQIDPTGEATGIVEDVQVNGASIVADGVANIPIASDKVNGVMKVNRNGGVAVVNDTLTLVRSTNNSIDARNSSLSPIVPSNLDYAVKVAMTDGKGAEWTSEEKASARERMGIEWRYIGKVETQEDVASISMALDSEGNPFSLRKVRILFKNLPNQSDSNNVIRVRLNGNLYSYLASPTGVKTSEIARVSMYEIELHNGSPFASLYLESMNATTNYRYLQNKITNIFTVDNDEVKITEINKVELYSPGSVAIGTGAYFEVWGVDA